MKTLIYIAGPMTGLPQFNVPAFNAAAAELRVQGYEVLNPAELDSPTMQKLALESKDGNLQKLVEASGETWADVLARDVKLITDAKVTDIVLLPGWTKSRGARLEAFVGILNGVKFSSYSPGTLTPISSFWVMDAISHSFKE